MARFVTAPGVFGKGSAAKKARRKAILDSLLAVQFVKMHGAGNDYVYVDLFVETVEDAAALARAVSDRHTGIGGDGLILLDRSDTADIRMEMYNADGSRAQMCGNGLRCLALLARREGRVARDEMSVETDSGLKRVEIRPDGIRVDMGAPGLDPDSLPVRLDGGRIVDHPIRLDDREFSMTCVSMGNPHAVLFVERMPSTEEVARYGRLLENHAIFPERTNVEFVEVLDRGHMRQRTWERGSGETLACGTGACAVCVAGVLTGRTDNDLVGSLLGGDLRLEWDGQGSVFKTGPAVEVFRGEWPGHGM
jgi:diaminopimelate epimerase